MNDPWDEGYQAWERRDDSPCPYDPGTELYEEWSRGYNDALLDSKDYHSGFDE